MSELFTEEDVNKACRTSIITEFKNQFRNIYKSIHAKIQKDPKPKYYYHKVKDNFDEIYAISDIHADYKALLRHLVKFEFIIYDENSGLNFENIDTDEFDIYNPKLISHVKWNKSNTLLVICGDIVDGCRTGYDNNDNPFIKGEVNDKKGTFEILLHMFLRNLKLQAQKKSSDVMLIVGNHDNVTDNQFWNNYVHSTAKTFFKNKDNRKNILTPFYKNFSLFFGITNLDRENLTIHEFDILFTHGGIKYYGYNFLNDTLNDQIEVNNNNTDIMKIIIKYTNEVNGSEAPNALWTRDTDEDNIPTVDDPKCQYYKSIRPTIVVGHCPTAYHDQNEYDQPEDDNRICSKTNHGFCIYPKCFKEKQGKNVPKVINIDTSMSGAFIDNTPEKMQAFEMLKIYKGGENSDFNKYTTVSINKKGSIVEYDLENVYNELVIKKQSESPKSSGGKTRRRKRKTSNKSKRSKRIKKSKQTRKRGRKTRR